MTLSLSARLSPGLLGRKICRRVAPLRLPPTSHTTQHIVNLGSSFAAGFHLLQTQKHISRIMNWVQRKIYLYNVTFGLYMLDWWERYLFNTLVVMLMWFIFRYLADFCKRYLH